MVFSWMKSIIVLLKSILKMDPAQIFYSTDKIKILHYVSVTHSLVWMTALDFILRRMNAWSVIRGFILQTEDVWK